MDSKIITYSHNFRKENIMSAGDRKKRTRRTPSKNDNNSHRLST